MKFLNITKIYGGKLMSSKSINNYGSTVETKDKVLKSWNSKQL